MTEEYLSGNNHDDRVPVQHQSHSTDKVSYLIASSLNPHNMKYVTVDTNLSRHAIKMIDSKLCCHHSSCQETPISAQSDEASIHVSRCSHVRRRNCMSDVIDLSSCTSSTSAMPQKLWTDLSKNKDTGMIEQVGFDPILSEENMNIMTSTDMSVSSFNIEPHNSNSRIFLSPWNQNLKTSCQTKSHNFINPNIATSSARPVQEMSAENSPMSQEIYTQEKESSNSYSGQMQQRVSNMFLKTCKCRVCQHCFKDVFSLNFHIYKDHEETARPTCIKCSATLVSLYSLFRHLMVCIFSSECSAARWVRAGCNRLSATYPVDYARHRRFLVKETAKMDKQRLASGPSRCNELTISGSDRNRIDSIIRNLNEELKSRDPETRPTFSCGTCGKEYKHKKTLITHMKFKHLGVQKKTYKCGFCLRPFSSLWQRNNHLSWRHFGRKPYLCQFCSEGFICLPTLRRHQRKIHTGEKPYICLHCAESFFEKPSLDLHKAQMHTGIFPFVCGQCGRGFVQRSYLKNHWKIHSGLRPHKCLVCGKKYSKISHLKRHKISCCKKSGEKRASQATCFHRMK